MLRQQEQIALLVEQVERLQVRVAQLEEEVRRLRRGGGSAGELSLKPSRREREKKERKRRQRAFVRPVVARKISGGTRSPKGSATKTALMSLFGTWQAQGQPLLDTCQKLLISPGNPPACEQCQFPRSRHAGHSRHASAVAGNRGGGQGSSPSCLSTWTDCALTIVAAARGTCAKKARQ